MANKKFRRKSRNIDSVESILIVTEGTKTEPNYFNSFKRNLYRTQVEIVGEGKVRHSLVKQAIKLKESLNYSEVWVVFDMDNKADEPIFEQVVKARSLANKNNIKLAFSNDSFELWYCLHFDYCDSLTHRSLYLPFLNNNLVDKKGNPIKYNKGSLDMYQLLLDRQDIAISNAKRLFNYHTKTIGIPEYEIERMNPVTLVHLLVERLNKNLRQ